MSLLEVKNLSHSFENKILYNDCSFNLYAGEHMGIVGPNGTGKTTLFNILIDEIVPDDGFINWNPKIKTGYLDQYVKVDESKTIYNYLQTAFSELIIIEQKLNVLYEELSTNSNEKLLQQVYDYQLLLEKEGFYDINTKINYVASGLGITAIGMDTQLRNLSGGQKAKIIMAKLLLEKPTVLLLDEPTNFLDKEHVKWLANYLKTFEGAFIIISHNFDFLDEITNCICDIEFGQITKYTGNYRSFLKQKGQKREEYIRQYESQKKLIERTTDYIAKNKARAATAGMAKSRQKMLDKVERIARPQVIPKPSFQFKYVPISSQIGLEVNNLEIGYTYPLLSEIQFKVKNGDYVVITGFNGIGKSTLLKTLLGEIPCLSGSYKFAENIKTAYFSQELKWNDAAQTPVQFICGQYPDLTQTEVRKALAKCGIKAEHMLQALSTLSGGEQAKVKLCQLTLTSCNMLILDEPANHLDYDAKNALREALEKFEGTVLLVSHEESFYKESADNIIRLT